MQSLSPKKLVFITVSVALIVGVVLWRLAEHQITDMTTENSRSEAGQGRESVAGSESSETPQAKLAVVQAESSSSQAGSSSVSAAESVKAKAITDKAAAEREKVKAQRLAEARRNIAHMHKLLRPGSDRSLAFAFAKKLSKGIAQERWEAIDAYGYLGGNEAVNALLPIMRDDEMLADRVSEVLRHMIEESLFTQNPIMDNDAWLEVIELAGNRMGKDSYLTLLASFSEIESVPVLMELLGSDNALDKKLAGDYMSFIAGGKTFKDSKDAESWWQGWLDKRNITAADLKKYNDAKKVANELLGISGDAASKPDGAEGQPSPAPQKK